MPITENIYYHIYHQEEILPVVLIHGAGGNHLYWPSDVRRMVACRVYALDLPGHGKSGGRGRQTLSEYADAILNWMTAIGVHRAVVVGHSMGGGIALSLALDHPQRVAGLGLVATGANLPVNSGLIEESSNATTFQNAVENVVRWSFSKDTAGKLTELAKQRMLLTRPSVFHGDLVACTQFDVSDRLSKILAPTLVVCGDQDKMTPLRKSQYLADNIPQAHLEIIPGAGHMVMLENPALVAGKLQAFIRSINYI